MGNNPCPTYGRKLPIIIKQIMDSKYVYGKTAQDPEVNNLVQQIESSLPKLKAVGKELNPRLKKNSENFLYYNQIDYFYGVLKGMQTYCLLIGELPGIESKLRKKNQHKIVKFKEQQK